MLRGTHQVGAAVTLFAVGAVLAEPVWALPIPGTSSELAVHGAAGTLAAVPQWLGLSPVEPPLGPTTALTSLVVAVASGTAPDLDKPRALWARLVFLPLSGGHRHLWHSLLGLALWGALWAFAAPPALAAAASLPAPAGQLAATLYRSWGTLWLAAFAGYASHLLLDSLTIEGVPWLYPLPWRFGLLPVARWRLRTGGLREQWVVLPALLVLGGLIWYQAGAGLLRLTH
jgi:membrane-bound metal-dependent hydrolase YbcI (DUF457 family)